MGLRALLPTNLHAVAAPTAGLRARHQRARSLRQPPLAAARKSASSQEGAQTTGGASLRTDSRSIGRLASALSQDLVAPEDAALIRGGDQTAHVSETTDSIGATVERASSLEAIEAQRRRESAIANAKTAQDKALAAQQSDIYRLALIFSGDEGKVVKAALGDRPAETLVKLCRAYVAPAVTVEPPAASQDGVKPPAPTGKRKRATRTV